MSNPENQKKRENKLILQMILKPMNKNAFKERMTLLIGKKWF